MSSFYLWLDHEILEKGEAFTNYTGSLFPTYDPSLDGISSVYSSPFRQWVYDSSIVGATIPSGVFIDDISPINRGESGLALDYNRGRVIFNNNLIGNQNISAGFAHKDYNLYYTDEKEEKILFENSYSITSAIQGITGGLSHDESPFPCIFLKNRLTDNIPFAFGGHKKTETMIRCIVLATNSFSLDGLMSILNDSLEKTFPVFSASELPFDYLGDFKYTGFNYKEMCENYDLANLAYIDNVTVSKLDEIRNSKTNKKSIGAFIDFDVANVRYFS
jgi:hypothetical protein